MLGWRGSSDGRLASGWSERIAIAILCCTGARHRAVANLRLRDYDRLHGRLRFHEKGEKVIWKPVPGELRSLLEAAIRRVADRAGVRAHVHAFRAAFAVFYLERHPGEVEALKELMGHRSIATTQVYLRKLDRHRAMERVCDLS